MTTPLNVRCLLPALTRGLLLLGASVVLCGSGSPAETKESSPEEPPGWIEGIVTFTGEIPKSLVPDDAGIRRNLVERDAETGGLRYAVVWVERSDSAAPALQEHTSAVMDQQNHEFVPRVIAVRSGQPVLFTNSDPANHNVRTTSSQATNEFNIYTPQDSSYSRSFSANPGQQPIRVGCDIHPWMRGWIYIFDHPFFAVTGSRGTFKIGPLPPGGHRIHLRQPDLRFSAEREVIVSAAKVARLEFEIPVAATTAREEPSPE